jgi:hypothetical protein
MKLSFIVILSFAAAVAFPRLAGANLSVPPQALGYFESTLDYCAKVDPNSAAKYKEQGKSLVHEATQQELEKTRNSSEYKESYKSTTDQFSKTAKAKVVKECADFLRGR